jgi:hypothetical protein
MWYSVTNISCLRGSNTVAWGCLHEQVLRLNAQDPHHGIISAAPDMNAARLPQF